MVVPLEDGGSCVHHVSTCVALKTDSERSVPCLQTSASEDTGFSSPDPEEGNKSLQNFNCILKGKSLFVLGLIAEALLHYMHVHVPRITFVN